VSEARMYNEKLRPSVRAPLEEGSEFPPKERRGREMGRRQGTKGRLSWSLSSFKEGGRTSGWVKKMGQNGGVRGKSFSMSVSLEGESVTTDERGKRRRGAHYSIPGR